jgi:hypothetical protein
MKNILYALFLAITIASCSNGHDVDSVERETKVAPCADPHSDHVIFVKEYVDSIQKFVNYDRIEISKGLNGYQFTYYSDSVFDPRVNRVISRRSDTEGCLYRANASKDTLYVIREPYTKVTLPPWHLADTLVSSESAIFTIGNKKITIRKYKEIWIPPFLREIGNEGDFYFSDKYGDIETVFKNGKWSDLRISIKSASFLDKHELEELYRKLRKHPMYMN